MAIDVEKTLSRELRSVADGLRIPALPALPEPRPQRRWVPLLVAAVAVLFVAGAAAVGLSAQDRDDPEPAPPAPTPSVVPSPSTTEATSDIPTTAPTIPYVLDGRLHVDGKQVPGEWGGVEPGTQAWIGWRPDSSWWWGRGAEAQPMERLLDASPVISPNGLYVGDLVDEQGDSLSGFDTRFAGEGFGGIPLDLGDRQDGSQVTVRAVTDDGRVIAQGRDTAVLWLPLVDGGTVDLTKTAPGQVVLGNTPVGLIVSDGEGGEPYQASISDAGEITDLGALPFHDLLKVNGGGSWFAYEPLDTEGGEVESFAALAVVTMDASDSFSLGPPDGYRFAVRAWAWEDDDHLVARVVGPGGDRMARCSMAARGCVLIDAP